MKPEILHELPVAMDLEHGYIASVAMAEKQGFSLPAQHGYVFVAKAPEGRKLRYQ